MTGISMRRTTCLVGWLVVVVLMLAGGTPPAFAGGTPTPETWRFSCDFRNYVVQFSPQGRTQIVKGAPFTSAPFVELYAETQAGNDQTELRSVARIEEGTVTLPMPTCPKGTTSQAVHTKHTVGLTQTHQPATLTCKVRGKPTFTLWEIPGNTGPGGTAGLSIALGKRTIVETDVAGSPSSTESANFDSRVCKRATGFDISCPNPDPTQPPACSRVKTS